MNKVNKIGKAYYLFFYKLYCFFKFIDNLGTGFGLLEWRAIAIMQTLQIFVLFIIANELSIIYHKALFIKGDPIVWIIPIAIILAIINYYIFLYQKKWKKFESEFSNYSKIKNIITNIIVLSISIGIVALLIFSFHQYSLID